ncbi:MAG: hypothetical protein AAGF27_04365 [Pseudomonadota bacterium]
MFYPDDRGFWQKVHIDQFTDPIGNEVGIIAKEPDLTRNELVDMPRHALDVKMKEWSHVSVSSHEAAPAKDVIVSANSGGGHIVISFKVGGDGSLKPPKGHNTEPKRVIA